MTSEASGDFYLSLQHSEGFWPVGSWRREFWYDVVRENVLFGTEISTIMPGSHGYEIGVVGLVRGKAVIMFDDDEW